jgi:hypothetical protein
VSRKNVRTRIIKTKNNRKMEEIFSAENGRNKLSVYYDRDEQEFLFEIEDSHKEYHDIWLTGNGVAGLTSALDEFLHLTE